MISAVSDPHVRERTTAFLERMPIAALYGFRVGEITPGLVPLILPFRTALTHDGEHFQASAVAALIDFAGGLAALTLLDEGHAIATVDVAVKLLSPASGERLLGVGRALRAGRTLCTSQVEVFAQTGSQSTLCATGVVGLRTLGPDVCG